MNRALVIAVVGAIVLAAALLVNFYIGTSERETPVASAPPAPAVAVPGTSGSAIRAPEIQARAGNEPGFDIVRVNPEGNAVIAGRAAPGAEVTVLDGDRVVGKVFADARGEWVLVPDKPLEPGSRRLGLSARTADGKTSNPGAEVVLVVPEHGKDVAGRPAGGEPAGALAVSVPRDGEGVARVLQRPGGAMPAPGDLAIEIIDYDSEGQVQLSGTAHPGADLRVYLENEPVAESRADGKGQWSARLNRKLPPGHYSLRVDELRSGDRVARRIEVPFHRAPAIGDLGERQIVVVQPGNSLWRIARRTLGTGLRYTLIYEANKNQIRDPDLIYPGQVFTVPGQASN